MIRALPFLLVLACGAQNPPEAPNWHPPASCTAEPGWDRQMVLDAQGAPASVDSDGSRATWTYPACTVVFEGSVVVEVR